MSWRTSTPPAWSANQVVHEYLTYGMPLTVDGPRAGTPAPSVSSTSTIQKAASTSSWSPHSSGCAGQRAERHGGRRAAGHPRPGSVRQRHPLGGDGGQVAIPAGRVEVPSCAPVAPLPGGRAGVAGPGRSRVVSLQPAVRGPLRGRCGLLHPVRPGKRLLRVEVAGALFGGRHSPTVRRGVTGPGPAYCRPALSGYAVGYPPGLRGVRAGAGAAGEETAPLPAVPGGAGGHVPHPRRQQAHRAGRRRLGTPRGLASP